MKTTCFTISTFSLAVTVLVATGDDRAKLKTGYEKKPIPAERIKLTKADWRPPREVVFRAEVRETKRCKEIGNSIACGMVPELEIMEELRGRLKLKTLSDVGRPPDFKKGRAYNVRWELSKDASQTVSKAVKGGYAGLWMPSGERLQILPNETDWKASDEVTFRARYRRSRKYLSHDVKDNRHIAFSEIEVTEVINGKLSVRRLFCLTPVGGLEGFKEYVFKWKPSSWAKAALQSARRNGRTSAWLMFWEKLEAVEVVP